MGTAGWIILIVVVVVIAGAAAFGLMGNRRTQAKREQATRMRAEAAESTAAVDESRREAEEAAARAEVARAEAARAEQQATEARQGVQVEEARVEDRVRAADRMDPDVDDGADDYRPGELGPNETGTAGGTTYADPDEPAHAREHRHRRDSA